MKLRNFANRFLLIVLLAVTALGYAATTGGAALETLVVKTAATDSRTYLFNQYNYNKPTDEDLYTALDIISYNQYLETADTKEVIVAVVDTGLDYTHAVFGENGERIAGNYAVDFSRGIPNVDGGAVNEWYEDENGHGTHVAGIIADTTLPNVKILPIKIFYSIKKYGSGYAFENAIRYLWSLKTGKPVALINESGKIGGYYTPKRALDNLVAVNLSLGTEGFYAKSQVDMKKYGEQKVVFQNLIDMLLQCGIMPIVAAGNRTEEQRKEENLDKVYYCLPGSCDGVLAVSAYDNTSSAYALARFSYYNDYVSVAAPGVEIWSACTKNIVALLDKVASFNRTKVPDAHGGYTIYEYYSGSTSATWIVRQDEDGNYYLRDNGTSMATPFVTACYAMLMSDASKTTAQAYGLPSWDPRGKDANYLTMEQKVLLSAAATNGVHQEDGYEMKFGYGTISMLGFNTKQVAEKLNDIQYEITPSTSFPKATWQLPDDDDEIDWVIVCCVLLVGVILIWAINLFKSYCKRRATNDSEPQQS